jgi:hypothetical protein
VPEREEQQEHEARFAPVFSTSCACWSVVVNSGLELGVKFQVAVSRGPGSVMLFEAIFGIGDKRPQAKRPKHSGESGRIYDPA